MFKWDFSQGYTTCISSEYYFSAHLVEPQLFLLVDYYFIAEEMTRFTANMDTIISV